jgi:hypothetical protein
MLCPDCQSVVIAPQDLTVRHCDDTGAFDECFICPSCGLATVNHVGPKVAEMHIRFGAGEVKWKLPAEVREARPIRPVITEDDYLDFYNLLFPKGESAEPKPDRPNKGAGSWSKLVQQLEAVNSQAA